MRPKTTEQTKSTTVRTSGIWRHILGMSSSDMSIESHFVYFKLDDGGTSQRYMWGQVKQFTVSSVSWLEVSESVLA